MEIRLCSKEEYPQMLDMMNDAFDYGRENNWFQQEYSHCTPYPSIATDEEIERHFVCFIDGQIAGALGAYPIDFTVSEISGDKKTIRGYGIGQVSCRKDCRNQGVMSALLKESEKQMQNQERWLGVLGGDRFRYGNFGYDFFGSQITFGIDKRLLARQIDGGGIEIRQATTADLNELNEAYETLPSYAKRNAREWELRLMRRNYVWQIGTQNGKKGYMAFHTPELIFEMYGDAATLASMLQHRLNKLENGSGLKVMYHHCHNDPVGEMLYNSAAWINYIPIGMHVVNNPHGLLRELDIKHVLTPPKQKLLVRHLLGTLPSRFKTEFLTPPLGIWLSRADKV